MGAAFSGPPPGEDEAAAVRRLGEALAQPSGLPPAAAAAAHAELGEVLLARGRAAEAAQCAGSLCSHMLRGYGLRCSLGRPVRRQLVQSLTGVPMSNSPRVGGSGFCERTFMEGAVLHNCVRTHADGLMSHQSGCGTCISECMLQRDTVQCRFLPVRAYLHAAPPAVYFRIGIEVT